MEDKKCPLCGKQINGDNTFCEDCQQIAKDEFTDYLLNSNDTEKISSQDVSLYTDGFEENKGIKTASTDPNYALSIQKELILKKKQKGRKRSVIVFIVGLILLVIIGGIGSYIFKQEKNSIAVETTFWNECANENTPSSYSKYLVRFPNGQFTQQAEDSIISLRKQEEDGWNSLQAETSIDPYLAFNEKYPNSPYKSRVINKIDSIAWIRAENANTIEAYQLYLQKADSAIYEGKYAPMAEKAYRYLGSLKKVEGEALKSIKRNMLDLAYLMSNQKYDNASKIIAPIMTNYFGIKNKETKSIIEDIKNYNKENNIRSIIYTFDVDSIKVQQDNNGKFIFNMPVVKQTIFLNKNKKRTKEESVLYVELDDKKRLQTIAIKDSVK